MRLEQYEYYSALAEICKHYIVLDSREIKHSALGGVCSMNLGFWQVNQWNSKAEEIVCFTDLDSLLYYFKTMVYRTNHVKVRWIEG